MGFENGIGFLDWAAAIAVLAVVFILLTAAVGIAHGVWVFQTWWWNLSQERHRADAEAEAAELNALWDEVEALWRKTHYRHNLHCPACGWFARQAEGFPAGVTDCKQHGIRVRTLPHHGGVEVEVEVLPIVAVLEVPLLELESGGELDLWPEIVIEDPEYELDALGLPVFTQPIPVLSLPAPAR